MEDVMIVEKKGDKVIAIDLFGDKKNLLERLKRLI